MIHSNPSPLSDSQKTGLKIVVAVGAIAFGSGCHFAPERTWANLLLGNFFFISVSLAAAVFIAIQNLSSAGWSVVFRRVPEAMTAYLPMGAALTAFLFLGVRFVYPWAAGGDAAILEAKKGYLNLTSFGVRSAVCWGAWLWFIGRIVAMSRKKDASSGLDLPRGTVALSAAFLLCFGLTFSVYSIDWLMSLEPKWCSTIYPWYVFSGLFEAGIAALAVLLILLRKRGILEQVNHHHFHDVGKFIFAFSVFWAYLWFSQYLLIWYSNIPEETTFYVRRLSGGAWASLFWLNLCVNFVFPFALLLPASQKKRGAVLLATGGLLLAGHWLDIYLLVMPPILGASPRLGALEVFIFAGIAAVYALLFDRSFASAKPIPVHDPFLQESLHFEGI